MVGGVVGAVVGGVVGAVVGGVVEGAVVLSSGSSGVTLFQWAYKVAPYRVVESSCVTKVPPCLAVYQPANS